MRHQAHYTGLLLLLRVRNKPFNRLISVQRLIPPNSNRLILLTLPDGFPITTGFQYSSSRTCPNGRAAAGAVEEVRRDPNAPSGITCTLLNLTNAAVSSSVSSNNIPAVTPVALCAPRFRVMAPPTPVAAAASRKAMVWVTNMPAVTRGKEE